MSDNQTGLEGKHVFVMGGGKFGTNAVRYLKAQLAKVLVVDINPDCLAREEVDIVIDDLKVLPCMIEGRAALYVDDAVDVLEMLLSGKAPSLVVTAIPGNAVAKLVVGWFTKRGFAVEAYGEAAAGVLENLPKSLVSFVDKKQGIIVVSYMPAGSRCRDNCLPPKGVCASTGRPKLAPMNKLLELSVYNQFDHSTILDSKQLTGGLGAIQGKELSSLLKQLENLDKPCTLAIGTACDCHGVINLLKISD